jgi:hypothetical protein
MKKGLCLQLADISVILTLERSEREESRGGLVKKPPSDILHAVYPEFYEWFRTTTTGAITLQKTRRAESAFSETRVSFQGRNIRPPD